jgi:hypothetical protein
MNPIENIISYESLSEDIQKEVESYHDSNVKNGVAADMKSSINDWFNSKFELWLLTHYDISVDKNKRKNIRINIELPVRIVESLIETDHVTKSDSDLVGTVTNISRGGLFFRSNQRHEPSSILKLHMDLKSVHDTLHEIEALAMVMRCIELEDNSFGIGVSFNSIFHDDVNLLNLFIFSQLVEFINNGTLDDNIF